MRKLSARVTIAGVAVALSTAVLPASPAFASSSDDCVHDRSIRLLTTPLPGSPDDNRLWIDPQSDTRVVVCFEIPFQAIGGGAIVVDATGGGTVLPNPSTGNNPGDCNLVLLNPSDPVPFRLAVNVLNATVCFTIDGQTTTVDFDPGTVGGPPSLEIWRDGTFKWIDAAGCPVEWVLWRLAAGPATCMNTNARIF